MHPLPKFAISRTFALTLTLSLILIAGNLVAARIRSRAGQRLDSPALIADGDHARADAYVSLGVIASAVVVAIGLPRADPVIALAITIMILRITWQSWGTVHGRGHHHTTIRLHRDRQRSPFRPLELKIDDSAVHVY